MEGALRLLKGRWKLIILFHLFGGKVLRFSDLERAIPNVTQKMLGQQRTATLFLTGGAWSAASNSATRRSAASSIS